MSSYHPDEKDKTQLSKKSEELYLFLHKAEFEDSKCGQNIDFRMWCYRRNLEGNDNYDKRTLAKIINFPSYLCVKLPERGEEMEIPDGKTIKEAVYTEMDEYLSWDEDLANKFYYACCKKIKQDDRAKGVSPPIDFRFDFFREIYFFCRDKDKPYMYFFFSTFKDKETFKSKIRFPVYFSSISGYVRLEVHEEKIEIIDRLLTRQNVKTNKWFKARGKYVPQGSIHRESNQNNDEYYIDYETMEEIDEKLCRNWFIKPRYLAIDLEVFGSRGKKFFPSARERGDAVFAASLAFMKAGDPKSIRKACIVHGDTNPIEDAEVINVSCEVDVILFLLRSILYYDPDYILGHNIYIFDIPYLETRLTEIYKFQTKDIPNPGRLKNYLTKMYDKTWESSGNGKVSTTFIICPGINWVDTLPTFKRLSKEPTYSLDALSKKYLKDEKDKMDVETMFDAYKSFLEKSEGHVEKMTSLVKYCIQDSALVIRLFEKQQIFQHLLSLSGESKKQIETVYLRGEQVRCYANLSDLCARADTIVQNSLHFDYYCSGGHVGQPKPAVYRFVGTVDFTSLYPSIMQAYNMCYSTFIPIKMWPKIDKNKCECIFVTQLEPEEHFSISRKIDILEKLKIRKKGYDVIITEEEIEYSRRDGVYNEKNVETEKIPDSDDDELVDGETTEEDTDTEDEAPTKQKKSKKKNVKMVSRQYEMRFIKKGPNGENEGFMPKLQRLWVASRKKVKRRIELLKHEMFVDKNLLESLEKNLALNSVEDKEIESILEEKKFKKVEELRQKLKEGEKELEYILLEEEISELTESLCEKLKLLEKIKECKIMCEEEKLAKIIELKQQIDVIATDLIVKDKTQNAIKIVANSGYGFTGVRNGMLVGIFIAMCVTFIGRKHINEANDVLIYGLPGLSPRKKHKFRDIRIGDDIYPEEELIRRKEKLEELKLEIPDIELFKLPKFYEHLTSRQREVVRCVEYLTITLQGFSCLGAEIVYNDTDSSMANFEIDLTYDLRKLGTMMQELISGRSEEKLETLIIDELPAIFKDPLKMEFEDFSQMVAIKSKYYLKAERETDPELIEKNGEFKKKDGKICIKAKGVLTAKRGNSMFSKKVYQDLSDDVLFLESCSTAINHLSKHMNELLLGHYSANDLVKITELGANYKAKNYYMNVFSRYLKKAGRPTHPGERLSYIIVTTEEENEGKKVKVGKKCREIDMWNANENREPLDYQYYAEKGLQKQFDDLFYVGYKKIVEHKKMKKVGYKPSFSNCHFVHIKTPIKMIAAIIKDLKKPKKKQLRSFIYEETGTKLDKKLDRYEFIAFFVEFFLNRISKKIQKYSEKELF